MLMRGLHLDVRKTICTKSVSGPPGCLFSGVITSPRNH
jgi:hypothetical protein